MCRPKVLSPKHGAVLSIGDFVRDLVDSWCLAAKCVIKRGSMIQAGSLDLLRRDVVPERLSQRIWRVHEL